MRIRAAELRDRAELEGFLERWCSLTVARLGTLEHPLDHTMMVAERDGRLVGVLTHVVRGAECEVRRAPEGRGQRADRLGRADRAAGRMHSSIADHHQRGPVDAPVPSPPAASPLALSLLRHCVDRFCAAIRAAAVVGRELPARPSKGQRALDFTTFLGFRMHGMSGSSAAATPGKSER
jgi:hypothetical protein